MFQRRCFTLVLLALLVISLLSVGGYAGWAQGYEAGLAADGDGDGAAPRAPLGFFPFLFGVGLLFKVGFFLLLFLTIAKFFGFWFWGLGGGWRRHRRWRHGPRPYWRPDWDQPAKERAETGEPDAETSYA